MRCGCSSANLVGEDHGRDKATFLAFQDEIRLELRILRRRPVKNPLRKEGVTSKILVIQDVKWNTEIQSSDFIWKDHGTIQTVLEAARLKRAPFEPWLPE
jgi:hypothetical protein